MQQLPLPGTFAESEWRAPTQLPSLRGAKRISIDVEAKDPRLQELGPGYLRGDAYIAGLAVGIDGGPRLYMPVAHEGGGNLNIKNIKRWAKREFEQFDGEVVGAKLLYDLEALAVDWQVKFKKARRFYDVQVAEPLLDENRYEYNLDALSWDYLEERKDEKLLREIALAYGWKKDKEVKGNLWRMPARFVGPYAEGDADRPLRILELQLKELDKQGLLELFDLESRLIPILLEMRLRGVRVDVNRAEEVRAKLVLERDKWLSIIQHHAGSKASFMTADLLGPALEQRGLWVPRTAKTGKYSITGGNRGGWLKENSHDELANAIWQGRRVETVINTFIDGHVLSHSVNGRIHCQFHQLKSDDGGTIGRFSSSDPNLQNMPARDEELMPLVRGLFIPDEDEDWERQDESQMEYRLMAHYAVGKGSREFRQRYIDDPKTDYHKFCAEMLGVDPEDKVARKRVKNTNFAKGYGALAPKLALTFGCSIEEAQAFIEKYEKALPFTKATFDRADQVAQEKGYIRSLLGRYARFPLWEPASNKKTKRQFREMALPFEKAQEAYAGRKIVRADTYMALNRLLQLGNADYMKTTMVKCWDAGVCIILGAPLLTVHDELDWSVPRTKIGNEAAREALDIHEHAIPLRVPVLVEATRGEDWGATS